MRLDVDPEGVHQARVASRRLRSDLRTFRTALDPAWAEPLREELRWLGTVLGEARDADVLFDRMRGRAGTIPPPEAPGAATVIEGAGAPAEGGAHRADRGAAGRSLHHAPGSDRRGRRNAGRPAGCRRAGRGHRGRSAPGPLATSAPGGAVGGQASERRGAAHHPDPREAGPLRGRHAGAADGEAGAILRGGRGRDCRSCSASTTTRWSPRRWLRTWAAGHRSGDAAFAAGMLAGIERAAAVDARARWRKAWKVLASAWEEL